ncbi:ATP-dependent zinc metalloprotease FtsH [Caldinitratiruptor microaerophilus]|uniref:ATP-dependent zinc metalloprotease FtsH n=1 Tax=Caldinitratiruptor microaerophilus TaxID=671077 RepID=A0AA35GA14_9FIRM|nr:ATP-dependent zinc metalloprotease FtsH [Caldinitratiruptor microaerophilus]BDG62043.1 ATP-dependent zinc metalloprotease FtsH [Caldinitratiruptor microaerophilus]
MNKVFRNLAFYLFLLVVSVAIATYLSGEGQRRQQLIYSRFVNEVRAGNVTQVTLVGEQELVGKLKNGQEFTTVIPDDHESLNRLLLEHNVDIAVRPTTRTTMWTTLAGTLLPVILVLAAFFFIMQQTQGSGNRVMQFGKSRARLHTPDDKRRVTFDDVAGIDEVKEELQEIVDFLKHPKRYLELGARIPKGVLLYGAPGTGKTLLARAVAGEAGVPFFSISGSDFVEMFVGVGASRVRDLFEQAKKNSPCIVFIDEIDAVGRMRGAGYGGGHDEREQTLNQLLVEMDGFGVNEGIIVMAATNRPDVLDPALLRPGRFDRHIVIDRPDLNGRKAIFKVHARGKPLDDDVDLEVLAKRTPGFTGADIANLMNEAALLAARKRKRKISMEDLEQAIDRVMAGGPEKRSRIISEREKRITAYHEAGHALVAAVLPHNDPVHKVTIIPRGRALGLTYMLPVEDRYINSKPELMDRMAYALGGRAAEEIVFGDLTSGAQSDIEWVTNIARRMVTEWGMSEKLGPLTFGTKPEEVFLGRDIARQRNYSEEVAALIDEEVRALVTQAHERALEVLRRHRRVLEKLAAALLEKETLEGAELEAILNEAREAERLGQVQEKERSEREKEKEKAQPAGPNPRTIFGTLHPRPAN